MRRILLIAVVAACVAAPAAAQVAGKHNGLLIGGSNYGTTANFAIQVDANGKATTFSTSHTGGPWTTWANLFGLTMSADNKTVVVPGIIGTSTSPLTLGLMRYDPSVKAMVGTIWSGVSSTANITNYANWTMNSNGEIVTIDNSTTPQAVAVYDPLAKTWTRHNLPTSFQNPSSTGLGGLDWDKFNGGYHHSTGFASTLYKTAFNFLVHTTIAQGRGSVTDTARYGGTMLENGDWISSSCCAYRYLKVAAGSTMFTPGPVAAGLICYDVTGEKYAAPGLGFWAANYVPYNAQYVDYVNNKNTVVYTPAANEWPYYGYEILPLYNRDLGSERMAKLPGGDNVWNLYINPGAGMFAGKQFIIAASLTPPSRYPKVIALPDGREIYIGIDNLTVLSVQMPLPPLLTGTHGKLDQSGLGTAKITLPSRWLSLNGTVIHFCGVVLDAAAPSGIGWVTEPHAFVIDIK